MAFNKYIMSAFSVSDLMLDTGHPEVSQDWADPGGVLA